MNQFLDIFRQEATELVDELEKSLLTLESSPDDSTSLDKVFRVMHTLKGNAAMFGFEHIGQLTHQLENIYDDIRNNIYKTSDEILSVTLQAVDHLRNLLEDQELGGAENKTTQSTLLSAIDQILANTSPKDKKTSKSEAPQKSSGTGNVCTYYIAFHPETDFMKNGANPIYILDDLKALGKTKITAHRKNIPSLIDLDPTKCYTFWEIYLASDRSLEDIQDVFLFVEDDASIDIHKVVEADLLKSEEFVAKIELERENQVLVDIDELQAYVNYLLQIIRDKEVDDVKTTQEKKEQKISSIRVSSDKIDQMMNLVSELVTTQARLTNISEDLNLPDLSAIAENVEKLSRQLRDNAFSVSMVPINQLFMRFKRMVRDLSIELKKEVLFLVEGGDTELDKNLIDTLSDPIMHILRNCLDHGIESKSERQKLGKSDVAKIVLKAYYSGANVVIKVSDDGAGLNLQKIRDKAISKGLVKPDEMLDEKQAANLLFTPGFSTASKVTDVSGRGVGMDIVKKKIDEINGGVTIESVAGAGTSITIKLPLTLSIIDGLLVNVDQISYIIQVAIVNKINVLESKIVREAYNDLVILDGEQIQIVDLRKEFNYGDYEKSYTQVVVVEFEETRIGVVVDQVVGEIQAVIKPLSKLYKDQEYISGATILGDGSVALILDTNKLISQSIN